MDGKGVAAGMAHETDVDRGRDACRRDRHAGRRGWLTGTVDATILRSSEVRCRATRRSSRAASAASPLTSTRADPWRPAPNMISSPGSPATVSAARPRVLVGASGDVDHDRARTSFAIPPGPTTRPEGIGQLRGDGGAPNPPGHVYVLGVMKNSTVFIGPSKGAGAEQGPGRTVSTSFSHGVRSRTDRRTLSGVAGQGGPDDSGPAVGSPFTHDQVGARSEVDQPSHSVGRSGPSSTKRSHRFVALLLGEAETTSCGDPSILRPRKGFRGRRVTPRPSASHLDPLGINRAARP